MVSRLSKLHESLSSLGGYLTDTPRRREENGDYASIRSARPNSHFATCLSADKCCIGARFVASPADATRRDATRRDATRRVQPQRGESPRAAERRKFGHCTLSSPAAIPARHVTIKNARPRKWTRGDQWRRWRRRRMKWRNATLPFGNRGYSVTHTWSDVSPIPRPIRLLVCSTHVDGYVVADTRIALGHRRCMRARNLPSARAVTVARRKTPDYESVRFTEMCR